MKWKRQVINSLALKKISSKDKDLLEEKFSLAEVLEALSSCGDYKAPGRMVLILNLLKTIGMSLKGIL